MTKGKSLMHQSAPSQGWLVIGSRCAGRITHHEEVSRLRKVYELVKEARQQVEGEQASYYEWPVMSVCSSKWAVFAGELLTFLLALSGSRTRSEGSECVCRLHKPQRSQLQPECNV